MKTKEENLNKIIHEHLMSMDFDAHSDKCTPTERALFFRMKDVAFAYSDLTNAKLVEENERLKEANNNKATYIEEMESELSAAKERVKELEKINLIKNKLNDELTIMGTNYAVIINKLENETRLFYKIIVFLTVLFFIIKIINIFI